MVRPSSEAANPRFTFADLFAGIGGIRAGLESADGSCVYSVESNRYARATYEANWGPVDASRVQDVTVQDLNDPDILAAGFPCQPFSLAGVSKKVSLGRAHGFQDAVSGNLFFEIVRLIGGPTDYDPASLREEAEIPDGDERRFEAGTHPAADAAPVLLLENVRHLLTHDQRRTYRVIRRRLTRSGYRVAAHVINGAAWVPQNRRRTIIVAVRNDLFEQEVRLPEPPDPTLGPGLQRSMLEHEPAVIGRYRLTDGTWRALERHMNRHSARGNGFGRGIARFGAQTRTLSARYYKDGAEILIPMPDGSEPPRRLTPKECAFLMGFTSEHLGKPFVWPDDVSDSQLYRQFGNSVVVPQFNWIAQALLERVEPTLIERRERRRLKSLVA